MKSLELLLTGAIMLTLNIAITIGLLALYKDRVVSPMIDYQDIYENSVSGWVCTTYEPSDAHPEMFWDWGKMSYKTKIVCHGKYVPPPEIK